MRKLTLLYLLIAPFASHGQEQEGESNRNQIVKLVLTPNLIYNNAFVVSYERIIKENQTLSITGGVVQFPQIFSGSKLFSQRESSGSGFTFGADYRFYLKKENKYKAPHGLYIAPFVSYYQFNNSRYLRDQTDVTATDVKFVTDIAFLNVGAQIGYQFVFNDRWTFDVIFIGPSISNYKLNLNLEGNYSVDKENEIVKELLDRFPLLNKLVDGNTLTLHGNNSSWAPGYRFSAMVGYKFGKKKK